MFGGGEEKKVEVFSLSSGGAAADGDAGAFWATERAWQASELAKPLSIQITDPQTTSSTFSSFTTYLVTCVLCADGVRRRYSDFEWMRDLLVARYHGIAVPLMPEKRVVGNQGKAFIEERMLGLENFMQLVLSNPYLRNDLTLRMFLTQKGTSEFEQAKKAAAQGTGSDPSMNTGLAHWFAVLRHLTLPADADAACTELAAFLEESEARVGAVLGAVTRFHDAALGLTVACVVAPGVALAEEPQEAKRPLNPLSDPSACSVKGVKDSLGEWSSHALSATTSLSATLGAVRSSSGALGERTKKAADSMGHLHDLSGYAPNEIQIFLMDGLVTEVHRIRSLKALLAVRDAAQADYTRAWVAQDKLNFQVKQFKDQGRADKAGPLEPKLAEAITFMKRLKERLDDISKGVLVVEADKVSRVRVQRVCAMFGQYAALCLATGARTQEIWSSFLAANDLGQAAMVADAQATLTGAMSMHALDATGAATPFFLPSSVQGDVTLQQLMATGGGGAASSASYAAPAPAPAASHPPAGSEFIAAFAAPGSGASSLPATSAGDASAFQTTDL